MPPVSIQDRFEALDGQLSQGGSARVREPLGLGEEGIRQIEAGSHAYEHIMGYAYMLNDLGFVLIGV